jgi:hypothetical protein
MKKGAKEQTETMVAIVAMVVSRRHEYGMSNRLENL